LLLAQILSAVADAQRGSTPRCATKPPVAIPAERPVLSSDCGMGREGMSRRHAYYEIVSLVLGTNMERKKLGLPQAECLAADARYSLVVPAK
jgi:hypothetical protein